MKFIRLLSTIMRVCLHPRDIDPGKPGERFALIEIANLVAILDVFVVGGSRSNDSGFDRRLRVSMDIVTGEGRKGVRRFASERTAEFGYLDRGGQWSLHCCSDFHEEGQSMNIK